MSVCMERRGSAAGSRSGSGPRFRRVAVGHCYFGASRSAEPLALPPLALPLVGRRSCSPHHRRVLDVRAGSFRPPARPLVWHGFIRFPADRVHKAVVEALARGMVVFSDGEADRRGEPEEALWAFEAGSRKDRLSGRIGFRLPASEGATRAWERGRSLLQKLQFALWARVYAETDAAPQQPVILTLSQLCDDLGYVRLRNGAHRPEHKRQVRALVDLLAALQLQAEYRAPDGRVCQLAGSIWRRYPHLESDTVIAYAPGPWFDDPVWARFNRRVGLVGSGLLQLRTDRDQWAIAVGSYLGSLARMNGYRAHTLRVSTILEHTGLAAAERRNPGRMREILERALDRLEAAGVISRWDWFGSADEPDMDSPADLAALADAVGHWSVRSVVIHWPAGLQQRAQLLQTARQGYRAPVRLVTRTRRAPKA